MLQNLPDIARQEQMGCAHFAVVAALAMALLLLVSISFPPASDQLRTFSFDCVQNVRHRIGDPRDSFLLRQRRFEVREAG
jgi:hypothetical protein